MSRRPEFDDLVDGVEDAAEEARLRRVHDLLIDTEPPPQLTSSLLKPPPPRGHVLFPRRRLTPRLVLTGAAVVGAFLIGLLAGSPGSDPQGPAAGIEVARTVQLEGEGGADGAIGVGVRDAKGNLPMVLTVWGLGHLTDGDYYTLALTKNGKPIVTCGTFNVSGNRTTVRMIAAYDLKRFDGWAVVRWDAQTRGETPVLTSDRI